MSFRDIIIGLRSNFQEYLETRLSIIKLTTVKKVASLFADIASNSVIILFVFFIFLFGSFALAEYATELTGRASLGYGAVAALYLLITLLYKIVLQPVVKKKMEDTMIDKLLNGNEKTYQNS